jgi:Ca2+-binding EF-hand superfamily protein
MKSLLLPLLCCATGWLTAPGVVLGDDGVDPPHAQAVVNAVFGLLDCDLDGVIDPTEVDEHFAQLWHPADRDQSRMLSRKEYALLHRAVPDAIAAALFREADADADGQVSPNELRQHLQRMILRVDTNGDREVASADIGLNPMPTWKNSPFVTAKPRREGS